MINGILTPIQDQNPDPNSDSALLIKEEGKWNLIVAD
jgi:hypothetical protein